MHVTVIYNDNTLRCCMLQMGGLVKNWKVIFSLLDDERKYWVTRIKYNEHHIGLCCIV